jgi:hypothetical protein
MLKEILNFVLKRNMAKEKKYKTTDLTDFIKYNKGRMSVSERNSFEKNLQKDPFAEEASEGFKSVIAEEAEKDIKTLNKKLSKRTQRTKFPVYLRIAASVAVLLTLSILVVFNSKRKESVNLARAEREDKAFEIKSQAPILSVEKAAKPDLKKENIIAEGIKPVSAVAGNKEKEAVRAEEIPLASPPERAEIISESIVKAEEKNAADITNVQYAMDKKSIAAPLAAKAGSVSTIYGTTKGKVISADDNMPIAGVIINVKGTTQGTITDLNGDFSINLPNQDKNTLVASFIGMKPAEFKANENDQKIVMESDQTTLDEVVVVAYGIRKSDNSEAEIPGYKPPEPVLGKSAFDKYIDKNIRRPDTLTGKRVVVVLNILVRQNGKVDSIAIVRSPGKQFSNEAIRLLQEGPAWKPAEDEGKPIEEKVRVRIVFK